MELFKTIDALISTFLIRWLLLVLAIVFFIIIAYLKIANIAISTSLSAQKSQNANLSASLDLQNSLVKKQGDDMEALKKRLSTASGEVEKLIKRVKKFDALPQQCDEAVFAVTDTIVSIKD